MKYTIYMVIGFVVLIGVGFGISKIPQKPGEYDQFAQCINDSGTKFWGAFWCHNCNTQKGLFGKSVKKLPYIECSTPDGRGQKQLCKENGIEGYPTWEFDDGEKIPGVLQLETLSEKTGCPLPEESNNNA
jgi:hypothetical protein